MKLPLQIVFLGMQASAAVEAAAREKAMRLDRFCPHIMSCTVDIEQLQKHQQQGRPYGVRIHLTLPGHVLTVDRVQHEDVYVALRDAFDDMQRRLEDAVRRTRDLAQRAPPERRSATAAALNGLGGRARMPTRTGSPPSPDRPDKDEAAEDELPPGTSTV